MTFIPESTMGTPAASLVLGYTSPAWPARLAGVSIFVATLFVFFFFPNVPIFFPLISFGFMLVAVFFAAETSVIADRSSRTLTVVKKRIFGSTNIIYPYDDIAFLCQNIIASTNQKGETLENINYTIGLNSKTGSLPGYYRGRQPIRFPIPISAFTMLNRTIRNVQEFTRARELSSFIGVPLFVNGGPNDTFVNTAETIPGYIEGLQKIPDALAQAKKENDRVAREILGDKYPRL